MQVLSEKSICQFDVTWSISEQFSGRDLKPVIFLTLFSSFYTQSLNACFYVCMFFMRMKFNPFMPKNFPNSFKTWEKIAQIRRLVRFTVGVS